MTRPADIEFTEWDSWREADELIEAESAQDCANGGHEMRRLGYECVRCGASFWNPGSE